ncbi:hypothetical protein N2152v2_002982 [Parachlorella kessleri]
MHKRHRGPSKTSTDGRLTPGLAQGPAFGALHQQPQQRSSSKEQLIPPFTAQAFARLCVKSQSLEADNATLRGTLERVAEQNKALEAQLQASGLKHSTERRHQLHTQDSAVREAQLEDQLERQKTALSDLARTAEGFARENLQLKEELGQLRDDREDSSKAHAAMQERLAHLQLTCLALGAPRDNGPVPLLGAAPGTGMSGSSGSTFLKQMSATLLVLSDQSKTIPPVEPSRAKAVAKGLPTDMLLALRELEALKRERNGLQAKAARLTAQLEKLNADHRELQSTQAAERRAASMAATQLQGQLEAAQRKSAHLASQVHEKNRLVEERDAYVKQLERALLAQKHPKPPCKGRKQREEASAAAPMRSDQAATRDTNGAPDPAAAATPMSLTHIAAGARHDSSRAVGVAFSTAAGTKSSGGWCSYHLGSPAGNSGGRCSSLSLHEQGSAVRQPKQQRPGSSPGRLSRYPAAVVSPKGRASTPPLRPLVLAAILEALEQEKQQQGMQRQQQRSVWQELEGQRQHPGGAGKLLHLQQRQPSAAPTNPLFSLKSREGSPTASPWNPRNTYTPAALAAQVIASSPSAAAGEDLTQISPGCLASSLTFLHKNSLFQCSPLLPEAPPQPSPALSGPADNLSQLATRHEHVLAISHGQQHNIGAGNSALGLLSPGDAAPQREERLSAAVTALAGEAGIQQAAERAVSSGNPCSQLKAKRSLLQRLGGTGKPAALADDDGGGHAGQIPPQQSPAASSKQVPGHPQESPADGPSAPQGSHAATGRSHPSSTAHPGIGCGSKKLQRLGLEELQELPDQGFSCVADLLDALTPRVSDGVGGAVGVADVGGVCEQPKEQQRRQAVLDSEEGKEQHSSNMSMAAKDMPVPRQGSGGALIVPPNRHTQHRVGVSPAAVARLQTLKQGRVNRAADHVMHAAQEAKRDSYAGAASYKAEVRSRWHAQTRHG